LETIIEYPDYNYLYDLNFRESEYTRYSDIDNKLDTAQMQLLVCYRYNNVGVDVVMVAWKAEVISHYTIPANVGLIGFSA